MWLERSDCKKGRRCSVPCFQPQSIVIFMSLKSLMPPVSDRNQGRRRKCPDAYTPPPSACTNILNTAAKGSPYLISGPGLASPGHPAATAAATTWPTPANAFTAADCTSRQWQNITIRSDPGGQQRACGSCRHLNDISSSGCGCTLGTTSPSHYCCVNSSS